MDRVAADEAKIAPDRDKPRFVADDGLVQPIRIFATLASAIHKGTGEDIVIFQSV